MEYNCVSLSLKDEVDGQIDPIVDIIDYLVRCANVSFKNSTIDQPDVGKNEKIGYAYNLFKKSPTHFLTQFGKYLCANHLQYFENMQVNDDILKKCLADLKDYHSNESRSKRIRNRRYKALQKLQQDTDYFSEKQMMYRNPLLYEQLIGQYLTDDEIRERDAVDSKDLTFLGVILETVERNEMKETKYAQMMTEDQEVSEEFQETDNKRNFEKPKEKQWGSFDVPDAESANIPEKRNELMINANERNLLREEFFQEMYSSFIEGRDINFDYNTVDNDEEYDDLQQMSQDAEDKYFDSEDNNVETLEEHMKLVEEYGKKKSIDSNESGADPLDVYMQHISYKLEQS